MATELAEMIIKPWKKAVEARDKIIESLKRQRDKSRELLKEYVEAVKQRDGIIGNLVQQRDDLKAKLVAIEDVDKPADADVVEEQELPAVPGEAPGVDVDDGGAATS